MKGFTKNKKFFFLLILGTFLVFFEVLALELSWPPSPVSHIILTETTPLTKLVQYFYEWGIALGGLAAFIALLIGGFQYLTSMGEPAKLTEAKDRIKFAFLGLILLLSSYLILNTINPELTTLRMPPGISSGLKELECDTNADCPSGYECTDRNPGDGTKAGVCVMERKKGITCTKAQIFSGPNYTGNSDWIEVNQFKDFPAQSVKAFTVIDGQEKDCCSQEAYEKGYYGCGCYLQVFAGKNWWEFWKTCGDLEAVVSACETNIIDYTDRPIGCVKLIKASW